MLFNCPIDKLYKCFVHTSLISNISLNFALDINCPGKLIDKQSLLYGTNEVTITGIIIQKLTNIIVCCCF